MNSTSYMFSFILGLIVVAVFVIVLNSRFHFMSNMFKAASGQKVAVATPKPEPSETPVPTATKTPQKNPTSAPVVAKKQSGQSAVVGRVISPTAKPTATPAVMAKNNQTQGQVKGVSQIPNTGSPTELLPLLAAGAFLGLKLRKAA